MYIFITSIVYTSFPSKVRITYKNNLNILYTVVNQENVQNRLSWKKNFTIFVSKNLFELRVYRKEVYLKILEKLHGVGSFSMIRYCK